MYIFLFLAVMFTGCTSEIKNTYELFPEKQKLVHHRTVDSVKKYYFTDEAYKAIKDIPTVDGFAVKGSGFVSGVNFWSSLLSVVTGNGIGRKVITTKDKLRKNGVRVLIHEYIHHLDDLDRDGEGNFIDHDEFKKAFKRMGKDRIHAGKANWIDRRATNFWTRVFGIGYLSEHIAYTGEVIIMLGGPSYMWYVFRKMLRKR